MKEKPKAKKFGQHLAVRPEGKVPLLDPTAPAYASSDLESYLPSGRVENLIGIGTTTMVVMGSNSA